MTTFVVDMSGDGGPGEQQGWPSSPASSAAIDASTEDKDMSDGWLQERLHLSDDDDGRDDDDGAPARKPRPVRKRFRFVTADYSPAGVEAAKKAKTKVACVTCRGKKTKCDGAQPCIKCKAAGPAAEAACTFAPPPRKRASADDVAQKASSSSARSGTSRPRASSYASMPSKVIKSSPLQRRASLDVTGGTCRASKPASSSPQGPTAPSLASHLRIRDAKSSAVPPCPPRFSSPLTSEVPMPMPMSMPLLFGNHRGDDGGEDRHAHVRSLSAYSVPNTADAQRRAAEMATASHDFRSSTRAYRSFSNASSTLSVDTTFSQVSTDSLHGAGTDSDAIPDLTVNTNQSSLLDALVFPDPPRRLDAPGSPLVFDEGDGSNPGPMELQQLKALENLWLQQHEPDEEENRRSSGSSSSSQASLLTDSWRAQAGASASSRDRATPNSSQTTPSSQQHHLAPPKTPRTPNTPTFFSPSGTFGSDERRGAKLGSLIRAQAAGATRTSSLTGGVGASHLRLPVGAGTGRGGREGGMGMTKGSNSTLLERRQQARLQLATSASSSSAPSTSAPQPMARSISAPAPNASLLANAKSLSAPFFGSLSDFGGFGMGSPLEKWASNADFVSLAPEAMAMSMSVPGSMSFPDAELLDSRCANGSTSFSSPMSLSMSTDAARRISGSTVDTASTATVSTGASASIQKMAHNFGDRTSASAASAASAGFFDLAVPPPPPPFSPGSSVPASLLSPYGTSVNMSYASAASFGPFDTPHLPLPPFDPFDPNTIVFDSVLDTPSSSSPTAAAAASLSSSSGLPAPSITVPSQPPAVQNAFPHPFNYDSFVPPSV